MYVLDRIKDMIREVLTDAVTARLNVIIEVLSSMLGDAKDKLVQSPSSFNNDIFTLVQKVNENVMLPIAGILMTYVLAYEIIMIINEKNSMSDAEHINLLKWVFKAFITIMLVSHAFEITMALFDVGIKVVSDITGLGVSVSTASINLIQDSLTSYSLGELVGILIEAFLYSAVLKVGSIAVSVFVIFRFMEIYCYSSMAAIPFAMWGNRELSHASMGYLKTMLGLAFQGGLMILVLSMFTLLITNQLNNGTILKDMGKVLIYVVVLIVGLKQAGSIAKNVFTGN